MTVSGITAAPTPYDGTTTVKLGGTAAFQGTETAGAGTTSDGKPYSVDSVSTGGTAAGTLAAKDVGTQGVTITGVTVTGTGNGNYMVTQQTGLAQSVTAKALTVSGLTASAKVYDGTTTEPLGGAAAFQTAETAGSGTTSDGKPYSVDSVLAGGTAAGAFATSGVGTAKPVTVTGVTVTGTGNGNYTLTQQTGLTADITAAGTTNAVTSSANPALPGASVLFTSTLSVVSPGGGIPTGSITFKDGASALGTETLDGSGVVTFSTSSLAHTNHVITAEYAGDGNFAGSTNSLSPDQVINTPPVASLATYARNAGISAKIRISDLLTNTTDADGDVRRLLAVGSSTNGATITTNGSFVFYVPPPASNVNSNATDYFSYTISDGFTGGLATNNIRMAVTDSTIGPPSSNLITATAVTNGVLITFVGIPNYIYHVQRTTTLNGDSTGWTNLGTSTVDTAGNGAFTDTSPPSPAYYRTVWP